MSYTEYLRRKEAAAPKVIDTTLRLDASSYTQRVKFAASRMINEANLKENEQTDYVAGVTRFVGTGTFGSTVGIGTAVQFGNITGLVADKEGKNLYIFANENIRKIVIDSAQVTLLAGSFGGSSGSTDGFGSSARFNFSGNGGGLACIDPSGTNLYVPDNSNHTIRKVVIATGEVTTIAGAAGVSGTLDSTGVLARFNFPVSTCIDPSGTNLYIGDSINRVIRKLVLSTGEVSTFAGQVGVQGGGNGTGTGAQIGVIRQMVIDPAGIFLYFADGFGNRIRRVRLSDAQVTDFAGFGNFGNNDGPAMSANFSNVCGIAIDPEGSNLYINSTFRSDTPNRIRRITINTPTVSTIAGSTAGYLDGPLLSSQFNPGKGIAVINSPIGPVIFVADESIHVVRRILPTSFTLYTPIIPINKAKSGGRIPDASTFTQYAGGQAVGKEIQAGMPAPRLLLNSTSTGSLSGCRIVPEPVPYNPAVAGAYTANMVPRDASQFTRDTTACRQLRGEPHLPIELGPPLFVDNTIVGVKNYNLPQNNSKTYIASECTQCGNNAPGIGKTCSFCIGANHLHPIDQAHNTRWGPRPKKSAQPIIVNQSPSDFHKVGAAMRKIPYVEKHHANPQLGHIVYPKTPYRIPRGTAAQLKINDPQRYPGTM